MGGCFSDIRDGNRHVVGGRGCSAMRWATTDGRHFQDTSILDLSEEIILHIVSKMSLRDVVNFSSVRKQWLHFPSKLDRIVIDSDMADKGVKWGLFRFIQHYGTMRSNFALPVCYDIMFSFVRCDSSGINSWIIMAVENGVTMLTVGPICALNMFGLVHAKYIFPWHKLHSLYTTLESLTLRACVFGRCCLCLTSKWTSLKTLELVDTVVAKYDMERIFICLWSLERLVLHHCNIPVKLRITSDALTSLTVWWCPGLEEINVLCARALTEFDYRGFRIDLSQVSPPGLTKVRFAFADVNGDDYIFHHFPGDTVRSLSIFRDNERTQSGLYGQMNSFLRLTELKLYNHPARGTSCQTILEILKACPSLNKLVMVPSCTMDDENVIESPVQYHHKRLKFIKISGFCGSKNKIEVAKLLVQVPENLHRVVVERKIEDGEYKHLEEQWHGEQEPKVVKDMLLKLIKSEQLTFACI